MDLNRNDAGGNEPPDDNHRKQNPPPPHRLERAAIPVPLTEPGDVSPSRSRSSVDRRSAERISSYGDTAQGVQSPRSSAGFAGAIMLWGGRATAGRRPAA